MKHIYKLLSSFLAVVLICCMGVTAFAAEQTKQTTVTTNVPCNVTLQVGDHGKVSLDGNDYIGDTTVQKAYGSELTYTFTPDTLYKVDKVIYNGTDVTSELSGNTYTAPKLLDNASLSVSFRFLGTGETTSYTVTFHANGHGVAPAAQTVLEGNKATEPTAPSESGWTFGGWYTDASCTQAYDFSSAVNSNLDLYAKWTEKTNSGNNDDTDTYHTITATAGKGGSINPGGSISVLEGSNKAFTITPDSGYKVEKVVVDGTSVGAVTSYTFEKVTSNHTISVTFVKKSSSGTDNPSNPSSTNNGTTPTNTTGNQTVTTGNSPKTGDTSNMMLWLILLIVSVVGAGVCLINMKRSKSTK